MADMRGHFPHNQHHASFYAGVFCLLIMSCSLSLPALLCTVTAVLSLQRSYPDEDATRDLIFPGYPGPAGRV
ncbi:hypothetical protein, partial [Escherichia coli]|uniref:hypothetical protein n=1 Tax=Escherichia coli TaxID=562 RepID=UPI001BD4C8E3